MTGAGPAKGRARGFRRADGRGGRGTGLPVETAEQTEVREDDGGVQVPVEPPPALQRVPRVLVLLPAAGGAGLIMHVLLGVSLALAVASLGLAAAGLWAAVLRYAGPRLRAALRRRAIIGLKAGLLATLAYDLARYGVVSALALSFEPFHVWSIFGQLLVGRNASPTATWAAGAAFHLVNGLGFAVAFALLFRRPTWLLGLAWGLGLELAMALLYPSWLRIVALQEFFTVSALGHFVYGLVLGLSVQRMVGADPRAGRARVASA